MIKEAGGSVELGGLQIWGCGRMAAGVGVGKVHRVGCPIWGGIVRVGGRSVRIRGVK